MENCVKNSSPAQEPQDIRNNMLSSETNHDPGTPPSEGLTPTLEGLTQAAPPPQKVLLSNEHFPIPIPRIFRLVRSQSHSHLKTPVTALRNTQQIVS